MPWVLWDAKSAAKASLLAAVAFVIGWLLTAATDEGGITWAARAGRALPAIPLCAAFGTWGALAGRRGRDERLALETLGRSPQQNSLAAVLGGVLVALIASGSLASTRVEVDGFFPAMTHGSELLFDAGTFVDLARGVRIESDGSYTRVRSSEYVARDRETNSVRGGRLVAAIVNVAAAAALSLLVVCGREKKTLPALAIGLLPTMVFFHAAAAARASPTYALVGALLFPGGLLIYALSRYREWHGEKERARDIP